MGIRKVPLALGIVAGIGLSIVCVMQLLAGTINMAVIFGVAGIAVVELGVMVAAVHRGPTLQSASQVAGQVRGMNVNSESRGLNITSQPSDSMAGLFVAPQPSMGHMDLRMDTASNNKDSTGIYIESEELMRGGNLQKLVYGSKDTKKRKKAPAKKAEAKRLAKTIKVKVKSK